LLAIVAQNKLLLVGLSEFHDTSTNQVVDLTSGIDKYEALIADPVTGCNNFSVFINKGECLFKTFLLLLVSEFPRGKSLLNIGGIVLQQVK
jgi:hypothetical protein